VGPRTVSKKANGDRPHERQEQRRSACEAPKKEGNMGLCKSREVGSGGARCHGGVGTTDKAMDALSKPIRCVDPGN